MKNILKLITLFLLSILSISSFFSINTNALGGTPEASIDYCKGDTCGLDKGVGAVKTSIKDVDTEGTAVEKITNIVKYLLTFITLIAVIYIMYAGFRILTSSGEDDVIKTSKNTIIYVIIGILVIWFAWAIANFAVSIGSSAG
ncbi:MAG: hypothetical protein Q9M94_02675 [Candidatus Gracilibacteria bacterium]|nr:hypothetical protein [Candidatus Gracilibacteria bacterium]